jgi:23S rRNA pseudouridine2457 synthase
MTTTHKYYALNKPYNMLSQFIGNGSPNRLLSEIDFNFPPEIHAIGRLDNLSEGLLLLTTNKKVTKLLFESKRPHQRRYLIQVANDVNEDTLQKMRNGVSIFVKGGVYYTTKECEVYIVDGRQYDFSNGFTPHKNAPHTWLLISLTEGKFHQVRKMVFALGHRCKRLIRLSIEDMHLDNLAPGEVKEYSEEDFFELLHLLDDLISPISKISKFSN